MREPVVSQIPGLVADRLDDEGEDGDGEDEGGKQQVQLRDHPDRDAAADDREPAVLRLLVGLVLGLFRRRGRRGGRCCGRRCCCRRCRCAGRLLQRRGQGRPHRPSKHRERGHETEKDQPFAVHHVDIHSVIAGGRVIVRVEWRLPVMAAANEPVPRRREHPA